MSGASAQTAHTPGSVGFLNGCIAEQAHRIQAGIERERELQEQLDAARMQAALNEKDARRYRRLRVLGCAPDTWEGLEEGLVQRFTNLDAFVDADIEDKPSRGENGPYRVSGEAAAR